MHDKAFREWLYRPDELTLQQFQQLEKAVQQHNEQPVSRLLNEDAVKACPHCDCAALQKWGWKNNLQRYRCKGCFATFNRLSNTPLARLRKKEQWLDAIEGLNQKATLSDMQCELQISRKTAIRWRRRLLSGLRTPESTSLNGIVEVDETFVRQSIKGCRLENDRLARYGGTHHDDYMGVWTARDRSKTTIHQLTTDQHLSTFYGFLTPIIEPGSVLCTDGKRGYAPFARTTGIEHVVLSAKNQQYVHEGVFHIQNVNTYHSRLKQFLSRLKGVATKYLSYYLTWLDHLDSISADPEQANPVKIMKDKILNT
jgi:transposase-like protein